jgi:hypothetical protein
MYEIEKTSFIKLVASMPRRLWLDLRRLVRNGKFEFVDSGIEILHARYKLSGTHEVSLNGLLVETAYNLVTTEGLNHLLDVAIHGASPKTAWYVAGFQNNVTIQSTLTAATFNGVCDELNAEISNVTRPEFVEAAPSSGGINNSASPAVITAASACSIWGAAIVSTDTKGDTSAAPAQVLLSAAKYSAVKTLSAAGDTLGIKYTLTGTSS